MQFKYPGGNVALVTAVWIIVFFLGIWVAVSSGHFPWYVVAGIVTGLAAMGIWFQIQTAGYLFGSINVVLSVVSLLALLLNGFSLRLCVRVAFSIYTACVVFSWTRNRQQIFNSADSIGHRAEHCELGNYVANRHSVVSAAKRGMIIGAVIGTVLGALTDSIIIAIFLNSPPGTLFSEDDSPLLIIAIFGIGPVIVGGLACGLGFALGTASRNFFRGGDATT